MNARDSYKGIPKKARVVVDKNGQVEPLNIGGGHFMTTGSGSLVNGYAAVTVPYKLGWHNLVFLTPVSGTGVPDGMAYSYVPGSTTLKVSGKDVSDNRQFSYMVVSPGLGSDKK